MTLLLGIDIGTTNCKAGIFNTSGELVSNAKVKTVCHGNQTGEYAYYPEEIWNAVTDIVRKALSGIERSEDVKAVSIASMAEAGLLVAREGNPTSPIIDRLSFFTIIHKPNPVGSLIFFNLFAYNGNMSSVFRVGHLLLVLSPRFSITLKLPFETEEAILEFIKINSNLSVRMLFIFTLIPHFFRSSSHFSNLGRILRQK